LGGAEISDQKGEPRLRQRDRLDRALDQLLAERRRGVLRQGVAVVKTAALHDTGEIARGIFGSGCLPHPSVLR
jgi:hypothetical protein